APKLAVFWLARAFAGFAGGLVSALAIAALADASAYARRGRQMSGVAISYFLAPVLGVPAGTWLAGRFGWRVVFGVTAVAVGLAGLLVRQFPLRRAAGTHEHASGAAGGWLADSYGKRRVAVGASVALAVLLLLLPGFNRGASLWTLLGLTAFVAALRVAPLQALITELVAPAERATYVALRNGMSQ